MKSGFSSSFVMSIAGALAFGWLWWEVPAEEPIRNGLAEFQKLTQSTQVQLELLHRQVDSLPRSNLPPATDAAQQFLVSLQGRLEVSAKSAEALRDSSRALATQIRLLKSEESRQVVSSLAAGLKTTADTIENRVCATAKESAELFDRLANDMSSDLENLANLLDTTPMELEQPIEQLIDGLAQAEAILGVANQALDPEVFKNIENACENISKALLETSNVVLIDWVTDKSALTEASSNLISVKKKIEELESSVPLVKKSANEASTKLKKLQEELVKLRGSRHSLDAFVQSASTNLSNAARAAPAVLREVAVALRDIEQLRSVTPGLRALSGMLNQVDGQWAKFVATLEATAELLETSASAADTLASDPEALKRQAKLLMSGTEATVEFLNNGVNSLDQLQDHLQQDAKSLGEISALLPVYGDSVSRILRALRWCLGIASLACLVFALSNFYNGIPAFQRS